MLFDIHKPFSLLIIPSLPAIALVEKAQGKGRKEAKDTATAAANKTSEWRYSAEALLPRFQLRGSIIAFPFTLADQ